MLIALRGVQACDMKFGDILDHGPDHVISCHVREKCGSAYAVENVMNKIPPSLRIAESYGGEKQSREKPGTSATACEMAGAPAVRESPSLRQAPSTF